MPSNIFFVAAINKNAPVPSTPRELAFNATGLEDASLEKEYLVQDMAPAMEALELHFGDLDTTAERHFLLGLIAQRVRPVLESIGAGFECDVFEMQLVDLVLHAQGFVRAARLDRVKVSVRDLVRVVRFYTEFVQSEKNGVALLSPLPEGGAGEYGSAAFFAHQRALILSIIICYFYALPIKNSLRDGFIREFEKLCKQQGLTPEPLKIFLREADSAFDSFDVPCGIAKTEALNVNLFIMAHCIQTATPLVVSGPPGCSKTLSFNIVANAMKGRRSHRPALRKFYNVTRFNYQCSEDSTALEVQQSFVRADAMQRRFGEAGMRSERCVVFLDEAGLPRENMHALKVIHFYLDHPRVGCVILANNTLDAAKTNRCVRILHEATTAEDLKRLADGFLLGLRDVWGALDKSWRDAVSKGMCKAYKIASEGSMYHQRDFVFFLRAFVDAARNQVSPSNALSHALRRNLNAYTPKAFSLLHSSFVNLINSKLVEAGMKDKFLFDCPRETVPIVSILREAVAARVRVGEDPNTAALRFVLVIDPSGTDCAVRHMFDVDILSRNSTTVCRVSDFSGDVSEIARSRTVGEIKSAMAAGGTVVLQNAAPIHSHFYDVFNRHFKVVQGSDGSSQHFANISIGSFSRPCVVNPNFQIVVILPATELNRTPLPFLNRFEKYTLTSHDVFASMQEAKSIPLLSVPTAVRLTVFDLLRENLSKFVEHLQPPSFYGLVPDETVASLALAALVDPHERESILQSANRGGGVLRERVFDIIKALMWVAQPHFLYLYRRTLPLSYVEAYLCEQEHLSLIALLRREWRAEVPRKLIIYVRSCSDIARLHGDEAMQGVVFESAPRHVIALASYQSQHELRESINTIFSVGGHAPIIVICDLRSVSVNQINITRDLIDAALLSKSPGEATRRRFISLVLHFPPEWLQLSPRYPTVYGGGWTFAFVDSVGFASSTNELPAIDEQTRAWLLAAFDLTAGDESGVDAALRICLLDSLETIVAAATGVAPVLPSAIFQLTALSAAAGLSLPPNPPHPKKTAAWAVRRVFELRTSLTDFALHRFFSVWSPPALKALLDDVSGRVASGVCTLSLGEAIRSTVALLVLQFTTAVVRAFLQDSNFPAIVVALQSEDGKHRSSQLWSLVEVFVGGVEMQIPPHAVLTAVSQTSLALAATPPHRSLPPSLPFVDAIIDRLSGICRGLTVASLDHAKEKLGIHDLVRKYLEVIDKNESGLYRMWALDSLMRTATLRSDAWSYASLKECAITLVTAIVERVYGQRLSALAISLVVFCHHGFIAYSLALLRSLAESLDPRSFEKVMASTSASSLQALGDEIAVFALNSSWDQVVKALVNPQDVPPLLDNCLCVLRGVSAGHRVAVCAHVAAPFELAPFLGHARDSILKETPNEVERLWNQMCGIASAVVDEMGSSRVDYLLSILKKVFCSKSFPPSFCTDLFSRLMSWQAIPLQSESIVREVTNILVSLPLAPPQRGAAVSTLLELTERLRTVFLRALTDLVPSAPIGFYRPTQTPLDPTSNALYEAFLRRSKGVILSEGLQRGIDETLDEGLLDAARLPQHLSTIVTAALDDAMMESVATAIGQKLAGGVSDAGATAAVVRLLSHRAIDRLKSCLKDPLQASYFLSHLDADALDEAIPQLGAIRLIETGRFPLIARGQAVRRIALPFVGDPTSWPPYGKEFGELKTLLADVSLDDAALLERALKLVSGGNCFRFRMYLICAAFYLFFDKGLSSLRLERVIASAAMRQALRITDEELPAFTYFTRSPPPSFPPHDELSRLFCTQPIEAEFYDLKYLLVNVIALTLSTPPSATELYTRFFDPASLANSKGVGSGNSRYAKDCGYITDGANLALMQPSGYAPFQNIRHFRLCGNFMTWAAMAGGMLLGAPRAEAGMRSYICTYWQQDAREGSESARLRTYVVNRPAGFLKMLDGDPALRAKDVKAALFVNASIMQSHIKMTEIQFGPPCAPRFTTEAAVKAYEDMFVGIFRLVEDSIDSIKSSLDTSVTEWQRQGSLARSRSIFNSIIHFPTNLDLEKFDSPLVKLFRRSTHHLRAASEIPPLLRMYLLLHSELAYALTHAEVYRMSLQDAEDAITRTSTRSGAGARDIIACGLRSWATARRLLTSFDVCQQAQQSESEIPDVAMDTPFCALISDASDPSAPDAILRLIGALVTGHNSFLERAHQLLELPPPNRIPLDALSEVSSISVVSVLGALAESRLSLFASSTARIVNGGAPPEADVQEVARFVCEWLVVGKFSIAHDHFRRPFRFRPSQQVQVHEVTAFGDIALTRFSALLSTLPQPELENSVVCKLQREMDQLEASELHKLLRTLFQVCVELATVRADSCGDRACAKIVSVAEDLRLMGPLPPTLRELPLEAVASISRIALQLRARKDADDRFAFLGSEWNIAFDADTESKFRESLQHLDGEQGLRLARRLADLLQSDETLRYVKRHPQDSLLRAVESNAAMMGDSRASNAVAVSLSHDDMTWMRQTLRAEAKGKHIGAVLRLLQRRCGDILVHMKREVDEAGKFFEDFVPDTGADSILMATTECLSAVSDEVSVDLLAGDRILQLDEENEVLSLWPLPNDENQTRTVRVEFWIGDDDEALPIEVPPTQTLEALLAHSSIKRYIKLSRVEFIPPLSLLRLVLNDSGTITRHPISDLSRQVGQSGGKFEICGSYLFARIDFKPHVLAESINVGPLPLFQPVTPLSLVRSLREAGCSRSEFAHTLVVSALNGRDAGTFEAESKILLPSTLLNHHLNVVVATVRVNVSIKILSRDSRLLREASDMMILPTYAPSLPSLSKPALGLCDQSLGDVLIQSTNLQQLDDGSYVVDGFSEVCFEFLADGDVLVEVFFWERGGSTEAERVRMNSRVSGSEILRAAGDALKGRTGLVWIERRGEESPVTSDGVVDLVNGDFIIFERAANDMDADNDVSVREECGDVSVFLLQRGHDEVVDGVLSTAPYGKEEAKQAVASLLGVGNYAIMSLYVERDGSSIEVCEEEKFLFKNEDLVVYDLASSLKVYFLQCGSEDVEEGDVPSRKLSTADAKRSVVNSVKGLMQEDIAYVRVERGGQLQDVDNVELDEGDVLVYDVFVNLVLEDVDQSMRANAMFAAHATAESLRRLALQTWGYSFDSREVVVDEQTIREEQEVILSNGTIVKFSPCSASCLAF